MLSTVKNRNKLFGSLRELRRIKSLENQNQTYSQKKAKVYPKRVFSGIQPTGTIHLGNYLGAIKEWVRLQDVHDDAIWSIVDMHAITLPIEPKQLQENIFNVAATLLACGIDPEKSILYQQSTVPMHAELAWILNCMTTMHRLYQQPQYKEKSDKLKEIPLGLYTYPVLQAADILLYKATHVPIGEDQIQHLQLSQHLVEFFNNKYGATFPFPQPLINQESGRIKSLREPTKKMSKSSEYKKSCIFLTDPPETITNKIKKAVTDFTSEVTYDPESRPGISNLLDIHSLLTDKSPQEICEESRDLNTGQYKLLLAEIVVKKLNPIRDEYERLLNDGGYLLDVLKDGSNRAHEIASKHLPEIKNKIGFTGGLLSQDQQKNIKQKQQII